jgi:Ni,Fe-hydrogenase maturation factor
MKSVVLGFGSRNLPGDDVALRICEKHKDSKMTFVACEKYDDLLNYMDYDLIIVVDAAKNIKDVSVISPDQLNDRKIITMHDMDAGFLLKLVNEIGMAKKIKIIGIPISMEMDDADRKVIKIIKEITKTK